MLFQFVSVLATGVVNEQLLRFAKNLNIYLLEILEFQTFNSERRPFPFTAWPDEEPGGDEWLDDDDLGRDDYNEFRDLQSSERAHAEDDVEDHSEDDTEDHDELGDASFQDDSDTDADTDGKNGSTTH